MQVYLFFSVLSLKSPRFLSRAMNQSRPQPIIKVLNQSSTFVGAVLDVAGCFVLRCARCREIGEASLKNDWLAAEGRTLGSM
jgi:hypothetical protein